MNEETIKRMQHTVEDLLETSKKQKSDLDKQQRAINRLDEMNRSLTRTVIDLNRRLVKVKSMAISTKERVAYVSTQKVK